MRSHNILECANGPAAEKLIRPLTSIWLQPSCKIPTRTFPTRLTMLRQRFTKRKLHGISFERSAKQWPTLNGPRTPTASRMGGRTRRPRRAGLGPDLGVVRTADLRLDRPAARRRSQRRRLDPAGRGQWVATAVQGTHRLDRGDLDKRPYKPWENVSVLVGRVAELKLLADCLAEGRPTVLVGEAGVGKTAALRATAAGTGRRVFEGGGLSTLSWMEYLPLRRAVGDSLTAADAAATPVRGACLTE